MKTLKIKLQTAAVKPGQQNQAVLLSAVQAKNNGSIISKLATELNKYSANLFLKENWGLYELETDLQNLDKLDEIFELIKETKMFNPSKFPVSLKFQDGDIPSSKAEQYAIIDLYQKTWNKILKKFEFKKIDEKFITNTNFEKEEFEFNLLPIAITNSSIIKNILGIFEDLIVIAKNQEVVVEKKEIDNLKNDIGKVEQFETKEMLKNTFIAQYLKESFLDEYRKTKTPIIRHETEDLINKYKSNEISMINIDCVGNTIVLTKSGRGSNYIEVNMQFFAGRDEENLLETWVSTTIDRTPLSVLEVFDPLCAFIKTQRQISKMPIMINNFYKEKFRFKSEPNYDEIVQNNFTIKE